jgi:hypothetical protein
MSKRYTHEAQGAAIANRFGPVTSVTYVDALLVHVSAAPTTSEYLTVTLNSVDGSAWDTVLYKVDLSAASTTDVFNTDLAPLRLDVGDALDIAYTNTDKRNIGVTLKLR